MAAESDIVIINITKNNDLNIIDCELRYSADWAMIGVGRFL